MISHECVRVLLIEEEKSEADLILQAFKNHPEKFEVEVAAGRDAARELLRSFKPDLLITNPSFLDGKGNELLAGGGRRTPLPVVIMTASGDEKIQAGAAERGVVDTVVKSPRSPAEMPWIVDRAIREWRHAQQRKEMEDTLRASEARFARTQRIAGFCHFEYDLITDTAVWSEEVYRLLGVDSRSFVPSSKAAILSILHPDDRKRVAQVVEEAVAQEKSFEMEFRILQPGGGERTIRNVSEIGFDDDGRPVLVTGILADLTERRSAEESLKESEERFRRATLQMPYPIIIFAEDGDVLQLSEEWIRITGYDLQDIPRFGDWCAKAYGQRRELALEYMKSLFELGEPKDVAAVEVTTKSGEKRTWDFKATPLGRLADGRRYVMSVAIDTTERRRMEEEIRRYTEELEQLVEVRAKRIGELERQRSVIEKLAATGQMAAGVAHEINNPLAGIKNCFLIVKDAIPESHPDREFVDLIQREIDRIGDIAQRMYQFYPSETKETASVDLTLVLKEIVLMLDGTLKPRGVKIVTEFPGDPINLTIPEGDLRQIIYNLLLNAADASADGSEVRLRAVKEGSEVRIDVIDEGEGILPEILDRIFDPFFTTKKGRKHKGIGLGLSVSHGLATAMGGRILVDSEVGRGTTIALIVPFTMAAAAPSD